MREPVFLTVIVPIYNAEQYVERCVLSLLNQTLSDYQLIIIDDCSTDGTREKLQQMSLIDTNIQVDFFFQTEHRGLPASRALGLSHAQGKYIGWCDADDWVDSNHFELLYRRAIETDANIVCCSVADHYLDGRIEYRKLNYPCFGKDYLKNIYHKLAVDDAMVWNKLFQRSLFTENSIFPVVGIDYGEDFNLCVRAFYYANKVVTIDNLFYHYTYHNGSMSQQPFSYERWHQGLANLAFVSDFLYSKPDAKSFERTCDFLKFTDKQRASHLYQYRLCEYYHLFAESYRSIWFFDAFSLLIRIKLWLIHCCYTTFWIYKKIFYS